MFGIVVVPCLAEAERSVRFRQPAQMRKLIYAVLIVALLVTPTITYAKEDEPVTPWPEWATERCINTIYKIVSHEAGGMKDDETFQFMTEQIIRDVESMGCDNLTQYRWAIGEYDLRNVSHQVRESVLTVIGRYPVTKFIKCKFIGMRPDLKVWASYGYDTTVGFEKTVNKLTVIGASCDVKPKHSKLEIHSDSKRVDHFDDSSFGRLR